MEGAGAGGRERGGGCEGERGGPVSGTEGRRKRRKMSRRNWEVPKEEEEDQEEVDQ